MGAAADKYIGVIAGVAGNQWLARPAFTVELAGEKIGAQLFRYPFLIDVHRLNLSVFGHGGVEHRCINANRLLLGGKLPDQIESVAFHTAAAAEAIDADGNIVHNIQSNKTAWFKGLPAISLADSCGSPSSGQSMARAASFHSRLCSDSGW